MKKIKLLTSLSAVSALGGGIASVVSGCTWSYKAEEPKPVPPEEGIQIICDPGSSWDEATHTISLMRRKKSSNETEEKSAGIISFKINYQPKGDLEYKLYKGKTGTEETVSRDQIGTLWPAINNPTITIGKEWSDTGGEQNPADLRFVVFDTGAETPTEPVFEYPIHIQRVDTNWPTAAIYNSSGGKIQEDIFSSFVVVKDTGIPVNGSITFNIVPVDSSITQVDHWTGYFVKGWLNNQHDKTEMTIQKDSALKGKWTCTQTLSGTYEDPLMVVATAWKDANTVLQTMDFIFVLGQK